MPSAALPLLIQGGKRLRAIGQLPRALGILAVALAVIYVLYHRRPKEAEP